MAAEPVPGWPRAARWVKAYSYITLFAVLYGLAWAHVPALIGQPWSTCDESRPVLGCVLTFHLFEAPPILFNIYVAWYGLRRFLTASVPFYRALLVFAAAFNLVFFAFECNLLLSSFERAVPDWEILGLVSIALVLIGGTGLTIFVHQRLLAQSPD